MTEFDHPVYAFARGCAWPFEERAAALRARGLHPLIAAVMAHEDVVLTHPPTTEPPRTTYERARARRLLPPRRRSTAA